MKKIIEGYAYVVGNNIDTDQIIPAEYLMFSLSDKDESKLYGKYAFSGVPPEQAGLPNGGIPFIKDDAYTSYYAIIIAGTNFGCGSSREHAPFALCKAGIYAVVAESYARIFYRNAVDGGFLIPYESPQSLLYEIRTGDLIRLDTSTSQFLDLSTGKYYDLKPLGEVLPIIEAGGIMSMGVRS